MKRTPLKQKFTRKKTMGLAQTLGWVRQEGKTSGFCIMQMH